MDQGGLAAAGHTGHADHHAEREFHRHVLQVMARGPFQYQLFAISLTAVFWDGYLLPVVQKLGSEAV